MGIHDQRQSKTEYALLGLTTVSNMLTLIGRVADSVSELEGVPLLQEVVMRCCRVEVQIEGQVKQQYYN